jgi:hypothetical protein
MVGIGWGLEGCLLLGVGVCFITKSHNSAKPKVKIVKIKILRPSKNFLQYRW